MIPGILIVVMLLTAQASPAVSVSLDRTWYSPGESVIITIQVNMTEFKAPWLWLYIDKPDRHNAFFTQLEPVNQTIVWDIPVNATEGMYTVTVIWDHQYAQTGFMVQAQPIPEFPFPLVVFLVAIASASVALARRKASARSKTLAPHP